MICYFSHLYDLLLVSVIIMLSCHALGQMVVYFILFSVCHSWCFVALIFHPEDAIEVADVTRTKKIMESRVQMLLVPRR